MAANVAHRIGDHRRYGSGYYTAAIRDKTADAAENGAGDASGSGNGGNGSLRPGFRAGQRQAYANAAGPYGRQPRPSLPPPQRHRLRRSPARLIWIILIILSSIRARSSSRSTLWTGMEPIRCQYAI